MNSLVTATFIHPTALVEKGVELGEGVYVGPFCHVEAGALIGDDVRLMSHVVVTAATTMGARSVVYPHAVLGCDPQNAKHKGEPTTLTVGHDCIIREGVTMHRGSDASRGYTLVGDHCTFLAYAHVAHDCDIGCHVIFSNNVMIGGHVTIGDYAILGGGVGVHQFVRVGHHAFVGGLTALASDLVPYGMAIGVRAYLCGINIVGMKRADMERKEIHNIRRALHMLFDRTKPLKDRVQDVLQALPDSPGVADLIAFIMVDTKRSFCTPLFEVTHTDKNESKD